MNKILDIEKVIPTIVEYIYASYDQSIQGKEMRPVKLNISLTLRDLTLALLCKKALGKDNIEVSFYGGNGLPLSLAETAIEFQSADSILTLTPNHFVEVKNWTESKIIMGVYNKILKYIDLSENSQYLKDYASKFIFRDICSDNRDSNEEFRILSYNFGDIIAYKAIRNKIMDTPDDVKFENQIFPLYWFTNEEVYKIGSCLGLWGLPYTCIENYPNQEPRDDDSLIERGFKLATSIRHVVDNYFGAFQEMIENIPVGKGTNSALTNFFMGECYGCYSKNDFDGDILNIVKVENE